MNTTAYQKHTFIQWEGLELELNYDAFDYPEVQLTDVICYDEPIEFLTKVSKCPDFIENMTTIACEKYAEDWADEIGEREEWDYND